MTRSLPSFETIELTEVDDDIVLVTLNRPDLLNAITSTMVDVVEPGAEVERALETGNVVAR